MSATIYQVNVTTSVIGTEAVTEGSLSGNIAVNHTAATASFPYVNGTNPGQAQHVVSGTLTVNTSGTTLDLTNLTQLPGADGGTRNFTSVVEYLIENLDLSNTINVGPGASNGWTGINGAASGSVTLCVASATNAGGHLKRSDPVGLSTGSTNKTILIASSASTASVKVTILGRGT